MADKLTIVVRGEDFSIELELPLDAGLSDLIEELIRCEPSIESQEFELHRDGKPLILAASLAELAEDGRIELELILPDSGAPEAEDREASDQAESSEAEDAEPTAEDDSVSKSTKTRTIPREERKGPRSPRRRRVSLSDLMPSGLGALPKAPPLPEVPTRYVAPPTVVGPPAGTPRSSLSSAPGASDAPGAPGAPALAPAPAPAPAPASPPPLPPAPVSGGDRFTSKAAPPDPFGGRFGADDVEVSGELEAMAAASGDGPGGDPRADDPFGLASRKGDPFGMASSDGDADPFGGPSEVASDPLSAAPASDPFDDSSEDLGSFGHVDGPRRVDPVELTDDSDELDEVTMELMEDSGEAPIPVSRRRAGRPAGPFAADPFAAQKPTGREASLPMSGFTPGPGTRDLFESGPGERPAPRPASRPAPREAPRPAPRPSAPPPSFIPPLPSKKLTREAAARYHERMNPGRSFPLVVILTKKSLAKAKVAGVTQTASTGPLTIDEDEPWVELTPMMPGCLISPPVQKVDVRPEKAVAEFWVTPLTEGRFEAARVDIHWRGGRIGQIPLPFAVVKTTVAQAAFACGMASPMVSGVFGALELKVKDQLPLAARVLIGAVEVVGGPTPFGLLLGLAFAGLGAWLWTRCRPKEGEARLGILSTETVDDQRQARAAEYASKLLEQATDAKRRGEAAVVAKLVAKARELDPGHIGLAAFEG